jgi:ribosomal protein L34E
MTLSAILRPIGHAPVYNHRLRLGAHSGATSGHEISDYTTPALLKKIHALHTQISPTTITHADTVTRALDQLFNDIYCLQTNSQGSSNSLNLNQLSAIRDLYNLLKMRRQFKGYHTEFSHWSRPCRYSYNKTDSGQAVISGYRHVPNDKKCTALTSYLKDVLAYENRKIHHVTAHDFTITRVSSDHYIDDTPAIIKDLINAVKATHPHVNKEDAFKPIAPYDKTIPISFFIRRSNINPDNFFDALEHNTHRGHRLPEVRPATAVSVLKNEDGSPITDEEGNPVAIGLLGDAFPFKKKGVICEYSEQGDLIFPNISEMITAQKCDIWSGIIQLFLTNGRINKKRFQQKMEALAKHCHVEGKWMDKYELYIKMINQAKKATGQKPMGSSKKICSGRIFGIPKNKYSDYVKLLQLFGIIPHNEAFMVLDLKQPFRVGINTHSKKSIENSLRLYQNTVASLKRRNYHELAQKITLAIYNNRTGEVKTVHPDDLKRLYALAPDKYTIDHARIHPDEVLAH